MSAVRQIGIKMTVDAQSVTTELPRISREFDNMGGRAEQAAERTTRSLARVNMSVRDIIQGAAGLHVAAGGLNAITEAIRALPREGFNYAKDLEVSQVGMAGILGSMTAINGRQTEYNQALQISSEYIRKLNDDALRTAASSQELTRVFQALLAPGLGAKMTLEEIRQLTVVGTNAVKSMGLDGAQVVQELRDLVAGGITASGSTLATALGLKDSDIAKAKASSEGLFAFLMERLKGFQASSEAFNNTLKGKLDSVKEGAVRVAAEGMSPLIEATKTALDDVSRLFVTFDANKNATLNPALVNDLRSFSQGLADAASMGRSAIAVVWENRSAVMALATAYGAIKIGSFVAEMGGAIAAKREAAQASRLLAVQQAAETAGDAQVVTSSRAKVAAYLAELEANAARARAEVAAQAAQVATLQTTQEAIVVARADVVAKMNATRATMAQAEAQIAAARAAGAQSMALALVREGTQTLTAAQARHAALLAELATLGRQQAGVQASIAAATTASTAAQTAATAATTRLTAAQSAASIAGRTFGTVMGALGGPVGIAIAALTVLIGKLVEASFEASKAAKVGQSKDRVDAAVAGGSQAEERDLARIRGKIEELKEKRDELLIDKKDGGGFWGFVGGNDYQIGLDAKLRATTAEIEALTGTLSAAEKAAKSAAGQTGELTLTVAGSEQAWRKANDGVKTATSIQSDYNDKLSASKASWKAYKKALEQDGASPEKIKELQKEQEQNEKALAAERDKQIKSLSAGAATARSHGIDAEIAATKHGYKLLAAQTAESIADVEAQRRMGGMGDSDALAKRTELQLADVDAQRNALQAELALLKGKKESAKEQANIVGELAELAQRRVGIEAAAAREQREIDAKAADELEARITAQQKAAQQTQENVRTAKLDQQEIGVTGAALGKLRQARIEETAAQLESQARTLDGIDLSGRAGDALRQQAADVRELAKTQGYNASAKMVADYAKAVDLANAATQFEQSLAAMSQRDRDIAIEQYRIAVDLQEKLRQIKADNPNDEGAVKRLSAEATATAAKAQADAANKVYVRETTRTVDQINDVFRKGFADMVNEGASAWDAFTRSLATSFKTAVADELYKAFAQPFVVPVVASVQGVINGLIQGGANALGLAGGSNLLGLASNASSLYSLTTGNSLIGQTANWLGLGSAAATAGAATGIAAGVGSGLTLASTSAGLGLTGAAGSGFSLAAGGGLGLTAGSAGAGAIGAGLGSGAAAAGGTAAAGGLTGALAAVPGWGWALAGGAMLLSQMDLGSRGANHAGAAYSTAGLGNAKSAEALFGRAAGDWYDDLTARHDASLEAQLGKSVNALSGVYKSLASFAGDSAKQIDIVAGFAKNPVHGDEDNYGYFKLIDKLNGATLQEYTQRDGGLGTDPTAAYTKFATDMANGLLAQLRASGGLEKWVDESLAKLGDAPSLDQLAKVVEEITAAQAALTQFGLAMPQFAAQSDAARAALMDQVGGSQALVERLGSFYSNYFSESERAAVATQQVTEQLQALGYAMPATRDEYRAWVTTAIDAGESGVKSAAGLLKLESAVAGLLPAAQSLRSAADIATKEQDLQIQLLRAQGQELAAVSLERQRELSALAAYGETAVQVQQKIWALQDQAQERSERSLRLQKQQEARAAAEEVVKAQREAFAGLGKSLADEALRAGGGLIGSLAVSAQEAESAGQFKEVLDGATASLAELEKLGLADELSGYTAEIGKLVQATKQMLADQVASSRLLAGNAQGAIAALMSASTLNYSQFTNGGSFSAGAFNAALAKERAGMAGSLIAGGSVNALGVQNVGAVIGQLQGVISEAREYVARETAQGIADALGASVQSSVVRALSGVADVITARTMESFTPSAPGLANIGKAQSAYAAAARTEYIDGTMYMGTEAITYARSVRDLNAGMRSGTVTADEYAAAMRLLEDRFGTVDEAIGVLSSQMSRAGGAALDLASAGFEGLDHYFASITASAAALDAQARQAGTPLGQIADGIGRMQSAATAFGASADAVLTGLQGAVGHYASAAEQAIVDARSVVAGSVEWYGLYDASARYAAQSAQAQRELSWQMNTEGSQLRKGTLAADAAKIAAQVMTTASAAEFAKQIQQSEAFRAADATGIRDASLLLDGVRANDATAFEGAYARLTAALNKGTLTEAQYIELMNLGLRTLSGEQAELDKRSSDLTNAFTRLRDAVKSTADELLLNESSTTLTGEQIAAEAQRQYAQVMDRLRADPTDSQAASEIAAASKAMLAALQNVSTAAEYSTIFAETIRDLRVVEAIQVPASALQSSTPTLKVPAFDVGTNYLPSDMLALVHAGERIIPAADNRELMQALSSGGSPAVVALLQQIVDRLDQLEISNLNGHHANEIANNKSAEALLQIVAEGLRPYQEDLSA